MRVNVQMRGAKCKNAHFIEEMPHFIAKMPFSVQRCVKCPIGSNRTTTYEQSDNKTGQSFA